MPYIWKLLIQLTNILFNVSIKNTYSEVNSMFNFLKKKDILTSKTNIGLVRNNNEDSVITLIHPDNKNIKLLAVADGLGGCKQGELASSFVTKSLENWFKSLNKSTFKSTLLCSKKLYQAIISINNTLYKHEFNKSQCGTTLTCAVVTEKDTVIANIGDSRAYAIIDNEIKQLTKDDSLVWSYYEYGELAKDELRFHMQSSLITKCIGHKYNIKPTILKLHNNSYNGLLLLTDGVTDCLSDEKINFIVGKNNAKNIASKLIDEAVYHKQENIVPKGYEFRDVMNGKDNATVALYIKYSS